MMNFKRCSTAVALLVATAVPALAHVPETVVVRVAGTDTFYRVPLAEAARLCTVAPTTLERLTVNADVVYCELPETIVVEPAFVDIAGEPLSDFEDPDDDDDDGDFGDDAAETAQDEAADAENDGTLDELTEDDDAEAPADDTDGTGDSDSVETEDVTDTTE